MVPIQTIARHLGLDEKELERISLSSFLKDKKKELLRDKIVLLSKYNVSAIEELERKIKEGKIEEHPAWEDLITAENLEIKIKELDNDIKEI
ncbi:MAG: hypothetical protein J7K17_00640 [Candidatus Omnitrophica bacterium]|nr:hypothetical protein [Candidatus Omnitrophota bacterium]